MATKIHPQAIVSPKAKIGQDVTIGPFAVIGDDVVIGDKTVIDAGAQILEYTTIGKNCHIFSYAVVGSITQDLKFEGKKSYLVIGDNNRIREFTTMNRATNEGDKTIIGNNNLFMAYSHVAHDCVIGDDNVFANCATLAGHVEVESNSVVGGLAAVHQFCRIGRYSIIGGCSKVVQDIPPYSTCDGHPAKVRGVNLVGLRRAKFENQVINDLKKAFKVVFFENHPLDHAKDLVKKDLPQIEEIDHLVQFISTSQRGISK